MRRCFLVPMLLATITPLAQAQRKQVVIDAADLAPVSLRAEKPTKGKWWLRRDAKTWGALNGTILMTGKTAGKVTKERLHKVTSADRFVPYRVPAIVVDPKVKGWYRIYVGLYHQAEDPPARAAPRAVSDGVSNPVLSDTTPDIGPGTITSAVTSFKPTNVPNVHSTNARPAPSVIDGIGFTTPSFVVTVQATVALGTGFPKMSVTRTTNESVSGVLTDPVWPSPLKIATSVAVPAVTVAVAVA